MSDTLRSNRDSVIQQSEAPPERSSSESPAVETEGDSGRAGLGIEDLFGDYSEQTGAFFG